jgi:DNA-binding MarR family transcriptional regulator
MNTSDISFDLATDPAGLPARVAIFGVSAPAREAIARDLAGAGFCTLDGGALAELTDGARSDGSAVLLGDVVVVDCPALDGAAMAGLARLDQRAARSGSRLVVTTSLAALDDVFGLLDQSSPDILIAPSRAEQVLAVGRACSEMGATRLREMSEEERVRLLQLSQQVDAIARSLDRMSAAQPSSQGEWGAPLAARSGYGTSLGEARPGYRPADSVLPSGHKLPDPKLVRQIIANRKRRARFFDAHLFADPAWDMLLDLTAAHGEGQKVSVTSLCIAAGVPATTALRWVTQMVETGVLCRVADPADKRRVFIALSESAKAGMAGFFAALEEPLAFAA